MNRRQRRRQRRRVAADPELYAQRWTVRAALATLILLFGMVVVDVQPALTDAGHALTLVALMSAAITVRLGRHGFRLRLAHRRYDWDSGDPTLVIENIADAFDADNTIVAVPVITQFAQGQLVPTLDGMADRITAAIPDDPA